MRRWNRAKALEDIARRVDRQLPPDARLAIEEDICVVNCIQITMRSDRRPDCRRVASELTKALTKEHWNRFVVPELLFLSTGIMQLKVRRSPRFAMRLTEELYPGCVTFDILGGRAA